MTGMSGWLTIAALAALLLGVVLVLLGRGVRRSCWLGIGETVSLDAVTLTSRRLGLTGRPDRLLRAGHVLIPEEWKSARRGRPWHRMQMGTYFLLMEDQFGVRPPYGFIVCSDGTRHRIENDEELRWQVLELAGRIRTARSKIGELIPVRPTTWQCRPCGQRGNCEQAVV